MNKKNILIICTGNTCRSPLIAAILAQKATDLVSINNFRISSAGILAQDGIPASKYSIDAAKKFGLNIINHRTRCITQKIINNTDLILCVTENHKNYILENFSNVFDKCRTISECTTDKKDIADPYGESVETYIKIAHNISNEAHNILNFIQKACTTLSIGCDHHGYQFAQQFCQYLHAYKIIQHLPSSVNEYVDYPDYAWTVAEDVYSQRSDYGILICKSGIGMSIAANKHIDIRAALCHTPELAQLSRSHNDANVLCLSSEFTTFPVACEIVSTFLSTNFQGERHIFRIEKISNFEKNQYNKH